MFAKNYIELLAIPKRTILETLVQKKGRAYLILLGILSYYVGQFYQEATPEFISQCEEIFSFIFSFLAHRII